MNSLELTIKTRSRILGGHLKNHDLFCLHTHFSSFLYYNELI